MSGQKTKVYVVLGESGEYSDRSVWVSGVFSSEDAAKKAMLDAAAQYRIWSQWHESYLSELRGFAPPQGQIGPWSDEQQAQAKQAVAPEPKYEGAEHTTLFACAMNEWSEPEEIEEEND